MEITNLTFIVTDNCNYNCSYCPQKKEKKTINNSIIKTAVDFFYPFLKGDDNNRIRFYGGEPLMAYEQIKYATLLALEKNKTGDKQIGFSLTTNGSLLTDGMLDFFNRHKFGLMLSFDGLAQDMRKKGSLENMVELMKHVREYPGIDFEINSVFSPQTIAGFSESLRFIIEQGGTAITYNLSTIEEWKASDIKILKEELARLEDFLVLYYKEKGHMPVNNFRAPNPGGGIFRCNAGRDHIAVTPEGKLWGCYLFHDYFKTRPGNPQYRDFCFGALRDFIADYESLYPGLMVNYSQLSQDFFRVGGDFCFLCEDLEGCVVCPVYAAYSSGTIGKITCRHCDLINIQRNAFKCLRRPGGAF